MRAQTVPLSNHQIAVGQYEETMYFIDTPAHVFAYDQEKIDGLLARNQGVGVISGRFDEALSIRTISGFAARLLGYETAEDVLRGTDASILHIAMAEESLIRSKLSNPIDEVCSCNFKGKGGVEVPVRIRHDVGEAPDGEKFWYISIRKVGESDYDALTGELNRRGFINRLEAMRASGTDLTEYAILYINLKGFKAINDIFGSEFGDQLLIKVYDHFSCSVLRPLVSARKESDKFLLLVRKEDVDLAHLPSLLRIPYSCGENERFMESVCGVYYIENDQTEISTMIDCAKMAKGDIKDAFVAPYAVFEPTMRADYLHSINILSYFDQALQNKEFKVYYQPVIDCKTEKIASAEALIRWETPEGLISPAAFIPALEENGCIAKLDEYVVMSAIHFLHLRDRAGLPLLPLSVNLSRMDFFDEERTRSAYALLQSDDVARRYIHFEITETSHRSIRELQANFIATINAHGGKVYIDDFGVANSSIDLLSQYDFSVLKLDMQFIRDMTRSPKVRTLVETTIHMAHELSMKVIAEGVETAEELALLRGMECDYIQGYYYSKPLEEENFSAYLAAHL